MSELLMNACSPSLMSTFPHTSRRAARCRTVTPPSFHHFTSDARPASGSCVTRPPLSDYDHEAVIAASLPLPLSREPSPRLATPEVTHVDDTAMVGQDQGQMNDNKTQSQPISQEGPKNEVPGIRRQEIIISPTSSTSANSMPTPQLTFTNATGQADEGLEGEEDEEELSATPSDVEDEVAVEAAPKTAAERLAEKRKMKRFRLTHSQTRFLMSEFSRQPHPDAAQRARLSKDIPGLSSRQVQVWFQNRRAKMKRLTGDDQERMMRSRALPTGFNLSRALQPTNREQTQPPSALAHFTGPSTNLSGGIQTGQSINRTDRRDVPPINMALIYRNPSYSLSSAGGSSNVSPSTSISGDPTYSANQSPLFSGSQTSSPFLRAGNDNFQRTLVPANFSLSTSSTFRARSGSLMSLSSASALSGGDALAFPRESLSMENMQDLYQSQYQGSNQQVSGLDPQLASMTNFQMPSPSLHLPPSYSSPAIPTRRNSSSATPGSCAEEGFESAAWFDLSSNDTLPNAELHLQAHQIRRRQTQPTRPTQQHQPSGMTVLSPAPLSQATFRSTTFPQARQASSMQPSASYETATSLHAEVQPARRSSFEASTVRWQPTVGEGLLPTDIYQQQPQPQQEQNQIFQSQSFAEYFSPQPPPSQGGMP